MLNVEAVKSGGVARAAFGAEQRSRAAVFLSVVSLSVCLSAPLCLSLYLYCSLSVNLHARARVCLIFLSFCSDFL